MAEDATRHYGWREFFSDYSILVTVVGSMGAVVSGGLWLLGSLPLLLGIGLGAFFLGVFAVGMFGHAAVSNRNAPLTLGDLTNENKTLTSHRPASPSTARSNLTLLSVDHLNLYLDNSSTFWEIQHGTDKTPFYSAVLRFGNEPVANVPGRTFNSVRARLTFRTLGGGEHAPVDRAYWIREEYNQIDIPVGDSRGLIVAQGIPLGMTVPGSVGFLVANNHYSPERYHDPVFARMLEPEYTVDIRIVSGEAGTIRYEGTFRVQFHPHLLLTAL